LLPLGHAAIAAGGVLVTRWRSEKASNLEREPNNTAGNANLLASGRSVRGAIGARDDSGHGDVDYYSVPAGRGARVVEVRLDGVPGLDLVLELFDAQGRLLAKSDAHGRGGGEWLQPTAIGPTEGFVAVRELWAQGQKPSEDVSDPYEVTATWGPPAVGWELEPNDWPAAATPVPPGTSMRGFLGRADDKDWFTIVPASTGPLRAHVTVPAGVDVELLLDGEGKRTVPARGDKAAGDVVSSNKGGPGEDEEAKVAATEGVPVRIAVARRLPRQEQKDPKAAELAGLDAPYELRVEIPPP
jgi:hypothetical protein